MVIRAAPLKEKWLRLSAQRDFGAVLYLLLLCGCSNKSGSKAQIETAEYLEVWCEVEISSLDFHSRFCTIIGLSTGL